MAEQQPLMKFGRDILAADKRASKEKGKDKDGKYGPKPSERLAASSVMMLLGVGLEWAADRLSNKAIKKVGTWLEAGTDFSLPDWAKEAVTDGGVAIAYAIVQKQLGEQLPKLKAQDLLTLAVDVGAYGGDKLAAHVGQRVRGVLNKNNSQEASQLPSTDQIGILGKLTNWLNPVTAGAVREGLSAGTDFWSAYRDVVTGVPEKPEEKKESVTKETTIIFLGNDQQLASALSTVTGEGATA